MEHRLYLIDLFDIYGELLTNKQQEYFEEYYFNNLSLGEISQNYGISRNGVYNQIKEAEDKLNLYEEKLNIYDKNKKIKNLIKELDENIQEKILDIL